MADGVQQGNPTNSRAQSDNRIRPTEVLIGWGLSEGQGDCPRRTFGRLSPPAKWSH
jgi:hypothetical protein